MSFDLSRFVELRPYAYHLTSSANLELIRQERRIYSAAALMEKAGRGELLMKRRGEAETIQVGGASVVLQTQRPLIAKNVLFVEGWTLDDLVSSINEHVFFWPGNADGPIDNGKSHYNSDTFVKPPLLLRIKTTELMARNDPNQPLFCSFNSGSPKILRKKAISA